MVPLNHLRLQAMIFTALCLFLTISCNKNANTIKVEYHNFVDEIATGQNLIFTFNKDLCPDSLLGARDTSSYILFEPAVKGSYIWTSKKELMFTPDRAFSPCAVFKASINNNILKYSKNKGLHLDDELSFNFHTPYLKLINIYGFWELSEEFTDEVVMKLDMNFNLPVDPKDLENHLQVTLNDGETKVKVIGEKAGEHMRVVLTGLKKPGNEQVAVKAIVGKGMGCLNTLYKTIEVLSATSIIAPPSKLEISNVSGIYDGSQPVIEVITNQPVSIEEINKHVSITNTNFQFQTEVIANGFRLTGLFNDYSAYRIVITKDLTGKLGGKLENDYSADINFERQTSSISFTSKKGIYLSSKGEKNIGVNIVNISKVRVSMYKIFENNLSHFFANRRNTDWGEMGGVSGYSYDTYELERYGNKVDERDYDTKDLSRIGNAKLLHLSTDQLTQYKGVYLINIQSLDEGVYATDAKLVSVSDIGVIAKQSKDEVWMFANSIKTAEPLSGVKMKLISTNNQTMSECITNSDGVAVFKNLKSLSEGFVPGMIYAYDKSDFNFMMLNDAEVQQSRFDVDGYHLNSSGLQTFCYGDRDLYRPGETIHTRFVLRNENWETPKGYPLKIKVLLPNGQEYKTAFQKLNEMGSTGMEVALAPSALTGTYTFEVYTANDVLLANYNVSVEEFMPDRIEVKSTLSKSKYQLTDSITGNIYARNLFGPPASNRNYEYEVRLGYKRFTSDLYKDFQFDLVNNHYLNIDRNLQQGTTDKEGKASIHYSFPTNLVNSGLLGGSVYTTVFDETGRPVHRASNFELYTQSIFIGTKQTDYWYRVGDRINIPLIAVNTEGKPLNAKARVKLVQVEWFSWMTDGRNGYSIRSNGKEKVISDQMVNITPTGNVYTLTPAFSGDYEVRIYLPGSEAYTASRFSAWGWGFTNNTAFEVNNEGTITIESDKESYQVGEDAKLLFKTPFTGKMLVTVEREKMTEYHYLNTDKKSASITLSVKDIFCPNVYISATLFHPSSDGSMPLTVAHGYRSIRVEKKSLKLPVQIVANETSRSRKRQTIKVRTTPGIDAEITIAVIDEGILNIKGFDTPDPYNFFYQRRALNVSSYDIYPFLMPDLGGKRSKTGGDAYAAKRDMDGRANPLANNRINLVAYWSGALKPNAAGEVSYSFDVPQFSGSLRVMAVVHKGKSFGCAEKNMVVSDPIILSPSIPRFLSPGDTAYVPMTVINTTKNNISGKSSIKVSGNLVVKGLNSQNVVVPANSESQVLYKIYAEGMGQGHIDINMTTPSETYTNATDITIRPSAGLQKFAAGEMVKGGDTKTIDLSKQLIPKYSKAKLVISSSPMVQFAKNLDYLVHYPYGCVEQTTSSVFPQLYLSDLMPYIDQTHSAQVNRSKYYIQEAIKKLTGMQLYNGAMSYWPGESYESHWGTAYATHFLIEARNAGYEVNGQVISRSLEYLQGKLRYKETFMQRYYNGTSWVDKNVLAHEYSYSVYVLALGGKADISSMNYMKNNITLLTDEGRFMLAAAYASLGDMAGFRAVVPTKLSAGGEALFGGSFYSGLREMAIALNVKVENDFSSPYTAQLVRDLTAQMQAQEYMNTQEASWCLMALGKYTRKNKLSGTVTANVMKNNVIIGKFNGADLILDKELCGNKIQINASGSGHLYYFYTMEGITADGSFKEEDSKMKIRRTYFDRYGKQVDLHQLKQNDMLVIKLSVSTDENRFLENVVVTDMLPAGFEIENPRISAVPDIDWVKDATNPDYFDSRDDRMNFFTAVDKKPRNFYYLVRCVSPGEYKLGPASADAMYRGEYHSMNGSGKVIIR